MADPRIAAPAPAHGASRESSSIRPGEAFTALADKHETGMPPPAMTYQAPIRACLLRPFFGHGARPDGCVLERNRNVIQPAMCRAHREENCQLSQSARRRAAKYRQTQAQCMRRRIDPDV
jgi:hypothetical protein